MAEKYAKCAKCGAVAAENPNLSFHRFPLPGKHGSLKVRVWAKYCFPDEDWSSDQLLVKLHAQHKMLCGKHFDDSSFTCSNRKRLNKFAIPTEAQHILSQLRDTNVDLQTSSHKNEEIIRIVDNAESTLEVRASTSKQTRELITQNIPEAESTLEVRASTSKPAGELITHNIPEDSKSSTVKKPKRKGILKELEIQKAVELTPKKQKLYKRCRRNIIEIMRLRRNLRNIKKNKHSILHSLSNNDYVNEMIQEKVSGPFRLLLQSQLTNVPRKLTGHRWTLDDKVLALSIYKRSSACYRLLRRLFCLPSETTLKGLLNKIPMESGINCQVFNTIQQMTSRRESHENMCVVAFDEMSIRKHLSYNQKLDQVEGFQDHAKQGRTPEVASHALTFMAIGLRKKWKQPLVFYFSGDSVTADRLAVLIKEVLHACFTNGLLVVAVVCDLDGTNRKAINTLGSSTDHPYFDFEGHEIVTIFDPPHLLKCFRNNFMKHNIEFTQESQVIKGTAKWEHIEEFYEKDCENANFVFAPALTKQHLHPNGKQKMKVCLAAQVLSHSVAAGIFAKVSQNELPQAAASTASVISKIDQLFDSTNGDTPDRKRGKKFLTNLTASSPHLPFFKEMILFFKEMKFVGARTKPPSQEGWIRTLNGIEKLFNNLNKKNIKSLSTRRLNQDPLENCFGCIRSNCGCNPNPTATQFVAALKTSLVTNLMNSNKNRNCQDDDNQVLSNFKIFLTQNSGKAASLSTSPECVEDVEDNDAALAFEGIDLPHNAGELQACAYVCGFIARKLCTDCTNCKNAMLADPHSEVSHLFSSFKEYDDAKYRLQYVNSSFCETVENAATIINNYLNEKCHEKNLKAFIINLLNENINFAWLKRCEEHFHKNKTHIILSTFAICIKRFCNLKNQGYVDEASKKAMKRKINILNHV